MIRDKVNIILTQNNPYENKKAVLWTALISCFEVLNATKRLNNKTVQPIQHLQEWLVSMPIVG